jgi:hypothetical protein
MRNPWADELEQTHRSPVCLRGSHDECSHLCGLGGGLNPRRFRLEFGAALCKCECHSSCPITGDRAAVPFQTWDDSCSCPGAAEERGRQAQAGMEFPDFRDHMAQSRRRSESRREAFHEARAKAAGRSREGIRDLYLAELRSRGLKIPPDDVLDANVDAITGDYRSSAHLIGRALADLAKLVGGILRVPR